MSQNENPSKNELPPAEVAHLNQLLTVQSGAVVSRTLLKRDTGTVTLFAFDRGEGLSEHTAPFDALIIGVDGKGEITISGQRYQVEKDTMLLMPAHEPHSVQALESFTMLLVMIRS